MGVSVPSWGSAVPGGGIVDRAEQNEGQAVLPGFDELVEVTAGEGISPEEARRISLEAQAAVESLCVEEAGWMVDYHLLRAEGWPWRVAAYIAWASMPRGKRWPGTLQELAGQLGLRSARTIHKWRKKNGAIDERVKVGLVEPLMEHRGDVLEALVRSATKVDHKNHPDRKLFLEMTKLHTPRQEVDATVKQAGIFLPEVEGEQLSGEEEEVALGEGGGSSLRSE